MLTQDMRDESRFPVAIDESLLFDSVFKLLTSNNCDLITNAIGILCNFFASKRVSDSLYAKVIDMNIVPCALVWMTGKIKCK